MDLVKQMRHLNEIVKVPFVNPWRCLNPLRRVRNEYCAIIIRIFFQVLVKADGSIPIIFGLKPLVRTIHNTDKTAFDYCVVFGLSSLEIRRDV